MKKKNIYKYLTVAAVLLLAACQNEAIEEWESGKDDVVQVNATIGGLQTKVNTEENGNSWNTGDYIRLTNTSSNAIIGKKEATFLYDGNGFTLYGGLAVWADGENTFQAFYPVNDETSFTSFTVPTDQSTLEGLRKADWMIATAKASKPSNDQLDLEFKHQMAKVVVNIIKYNDQYGTNLPVITDPVFISCAPFNSGITLPGNKEIKAYMKADDTDGRHSFIAILPDGQYTADDNIFLKLKINNEEHTVLVNNFLLQNQLESGYVYTFNLTVGKNKVSISSVTVKDWTTGITDTGTADEGFVSGRTVTLTNEVRLNDAMIQEALGDGHKLAIKGPMKNDDFKTLKTYLAAHYNDKEGTPVDVDLSNAELYLNKLDFTAFCTNDNDYAEENRTYYLGGVTLPKSIERINDGAFRNCYKSYITNWEELTSLTRIGSAAFYNTANEEVTFAAKLNEETGSGIFASGCFYHCSKLKKVVFKKGADGLGARFFTLCEALEVIDCTACTEYFSIDNNAFNPLNKDKNTITVYFANESIKHEFEGTPWSNLNLQVKGE